MIDSRDALREYIRQDLAAHGLDHWRPVYRLMRRKLYFQWLLRRAEYWTNCRRDPVARLMSVSLRFRLRRLGELLGFTIPLNTFGPGLALAHHGTITVHPDARIGARCRIHQGVTIGSSADDSAPVIGEGAHISPNACIIGGVRVGDRVGVWAGAVVTKDVPSDVSVAGVPARIVKDNRTSTDLDGINGRKGH